MALDNASVKSSVKSKAGSGVFFGWWTVMATGILNIIGQAFYQYGISALFKPIASDLGFNRTMTSTAAGIGKLEGGLESPISGWLVDKFGPKWVIFGG
ncbi:MAG: hypothetical protein NUV31_07425, partial [Dehalococcoidales bacterium]|nr:hypothetical protein [Dehalococcoidales bacterium]